MDHGRRVMLFGCIIAAFLAAYIGMEFPEAVAQVFHLEP